MEADSEQGKGYNTARSVVWLGPAGRILEKSQRKVSGVGLLGRAGDSEAEGTIIQLLLVRVSGKPHPQGPLGVVGTEEKAPSPLPVFLRTQASTDEAGKV